jgi:hypothetical protein
VIGALLCLFVGGIGGVIVTVAGGEVFGDGTDGGFGAAEHRTYGEGGDLGTFSLGLGQCATAHVDDVDTLAEGQQVDCAKPHATQAYAELEPPMLPTPDESHTDADRPFERDDLANFADSACYLAFQPYVGVSYDESDFDYLPVIPSEKAWESGERTVHCVLYPYDDDTTTGTAEASGH